MTTRVTKYCEFTVLGEGGAEQGTFKISSFETLTVLEPTWAVLEPTWAVLEPTWAVLEPTWAVLEPTGACLTANMGCLRARCDIRWPTWAVDATLDVTLDAT